MGWRRKNYLLRGREMSKPLSNKDLTCLAVCQTIFRLLVRFAPEFVVLKVGVLSFRMRGQGSIVAYLPAIALLFQIHESTRTLRLGELGRGLVERFALASHGHSVHDNAS